MALSTEVVKAERMMIENMVHSDNPQIQIDFTNLEQLAIIYEICPTVALAYTSEDFNELAQLFSTEETIN
jgi:hypothetical protein